MDRPSHLMVPAFPEEPRIVQDLLDRLARNKRIPDVDVALSTLVRYIRDLQKHSRELAALAAERGRALREPACPFPADHMPGARSDDDVALTEEDAIQVITNLTKKDAVPRPNLSLAQEQEQVLADLRDRTNKMVADLKADHLAERRGIAVFLRSLLPVISECEWAPDRERLQADTENLIKELERNPG